MVFRTCLLLLLLSACSSAPVRPAWYPPPACPDCYQGIGEANDYPTARERALADLCQDIRVVVESTIDDRRQHLLRQSSEGDRQSEKLEYNEVATVISRSHSRCLFENLPVKELQRDEVGGRAFVLLRLGVADYRRFLASRTVRLTFDLPSEVTPAALRSDLSELLRSASHPVTEAADAPWEARIKFSHAIEESVERLKIASGKASVQLVEKGSGRIAAEAAVDSLVARGYSVPDLLTKLEQQAGQRLAEALARQLQNR